jgi:hypothetical protein
MPSMLKIENDELTDLFVISEFTKVCFIEPNGREGRTSRKDIERLLIIAFIL